MTAANFNRRWVRPAAAVLSALMMSAWAAAAVPDTDWRDAGENRGVALETRVLEAGYRAYRGTVTVCTDLAGLQRFVGDAARLDEWIPYTEEVRALPEDDGRPLYYLRSRTPWPFKSRDMVYRLEAQPAGEDGSIRIGVTGVPDAIAEQPGAVRLVAADGLWTLSRQATGVQVTLRLGVDAGRVPGFLADRRLAATVAGTLDNLAAQFPCR